MTTINADTVNVINDTTISATFTLTGAAVGYWDVTVQNADLQSGTADDALTISAPPPATPIVTSIDPTTFDNDLPHPLTITGADFVDTPTARLRKSGETDVEAYYVEFTSDTEIYAEFDMTGITAGLWSVVVQNDGGSEGIGTDLLTITEAE